jgi:hypothetical protein
VAIAVENLTVRQVRQLADALTRVPGGGIGSNVVGNLLF